MPDKPRAEVVIDEPLVRRLLVTQATDALPDAAILPLALAAEGWDSAVWRLGDDLAVRLPRRRLGAPLIVHEQRWLPSIAARIGPTGIRVPAPLFAGAPGSGYPWAWSVVPWIDGMPGLAVPRALRTGWAVPLADALLALHLPAPADHPVNPVRGGPLAERADAVAERFSALRSRARAAGLAEAHRLWLAGLAASPWAQPPLWIHGDLHPGNLVAHGAELAGIIDFGDVTGGDPAYDLAVAWLAFDSAGRDAFIAATGDRYGEATWTRARAWAVAVALILLVHSDDNPDYAALGEEALAEVIRD
ncbi:phosphotransferase [Microbacterium ulmi]|uniref:Phosphotransferase n=1 Tax=Microbacterium ulmi TaxID=179095 RepID=A0A7Y2LXD6_9MICO|nr:aminoglycoside phosphotransferase (APT) family kinase protein [Microbacterium ulmi]NNH02579.1 phosphotransferase [Microbacterium ulmi]